VVLPTPPFWFATQNILAMYLLIVDATTDLYHLYYQNRIFDLVRIFGINHINGLYDLL
jgi:hypothetical protein